MDVETHFPGGAHGFMLAACMAMGLLVLAGPRLWPASGGVKPVAWGVALFMYAQEFLDRAGHHLILGERLAEVLPFHLCGMSVVLVPVLLVTRSRVLFEVLYYWGLGGAIAALLTPDTPVSFPHPLYITFFTSHALIVIGVVYAMVHYGLRPGPHSLWKAAGATYLYGLAVAPLNLLLDTNYLYLRHKPAGATLMDHLGPWPWYLVSLAVLVAGVFALLYLPWGVLAALRRGSDAAEGRGTA